MGGRLANRQRTVVFYSGHCSFRAVKVAGSALKMPLLVCRCAIFLRCLLTPVFRCRKVRFPHQIGWLDPRVNYLRLALAFL